MQRWSFAKGHGTENDFVLLVDRENLLPLGPEVVRYLCDRHAGIGADGVLRAVHARHIAGWAGDPELWFMDYRNADGSVAEMCGNGIRVFARHLLDEGLVSGGRFTVATRAGERGIAVQPDGRIRVDMGEARITGTTVQVTTADGRRFQAAGVDVGNPHVVSLVDDVSTVALGAAPQWSPADAYPDGVNQEFVAVHDASHLTMRVFERGSGETRSCGTGTVAAAAAVWAARGSDPEPPVVRVDVPGGSVEVELVPRGPGVAAASLTGPAVIIGHGVVHVPAHVIHQHRSEA